MRRARLAEASVCTGRGVAAQGARQGRERRVEKAHASCAVAALRIGQQQPATTRLLPVSSLSLFLYFSFSLSFSSIQSIGSQPCLSVPRELPPHSASRESSPAIDYQLSYLSLRSTKFISRPKLHRSDCFFLFFFFDIIKATATRYSFLPFDNITFHVPAREKVRLVPRAPLFFQKEEKKEREREKCARSRVLCENGFSRRDGYSRLGQRLAYPLKPEPADLRNGTEVSLVL